MSDTIWLVELELKRIQTYLFQVPRLRAMIGANALVGETLRGKWDVSGFGAKFDSLPALAHDCGRMSLAGVTNRLEAVSCKSDGKQDDPLWLHGQWQDHFLKVATDTGVLARDGGHFEAVFPDRPKAEEFIFRANELVGKQLPGARLEVRLCQLTNHQGSFQRNDPEKIQFPDAEAIFDLAQAEICQLSGCAPAGGTDVALGPEKFHASPASRARCERGAAFDKAQTHDVLGILRPALLKAIGATHDGTTPGKGDPFPSEFKELATQGYLAVVHVDGNSVGKRFEKLRKTWSSDDDFFAQWVKKESFFHTLRCGMRRAVLAAVEKSFCGRRNRTGKVPLRLLMLGGDDLLLVCGAPYALPFVRHLAAEVEKETQKLPDGTGSEAPLEIGAGVAIVQDSFPFHRAHQLAEQLATSAKRIKHLGSAVDWIVTSESWYGDIAETRRRTAVIDDTLIVSCKPYPILASAGGPGLEGLVADAEKMAGSSLARNQLQRMTDSLAHGRHTAHFVAQTLPNNTRLPLQQRGYLGKEDDPWIEVDGGFTTRLLDLAELYELERLRQMDAG